MEIELLVYAKDLAPRESYTGKYLAI